MTVLPLILSTTILSSGPTHTSHVRTADGLSVAVQEWGNPKGPAVVLIHGLLQSHLSWTKQTGGSFARRYRIITYDLRGHGESDAPSAARYYQKGRWGEELHAVIRAVHAKRPILVGWSMGGIVLSDYLSRYGSSDLGGLVYLDSWIKAPDAGHRAASDVIARMAAPDLATRIAARTAFLRACFLRQPPAEAFERQLAFNMLTPPKALSAMVNRSFDDDATARRTRLPVLVYHAERDALMPLAAARHTASTFPNARLVVAKNVGHASFYEDPAAFERAFAASFPPSMGGVGRVGWAGETNAR